MSSLIISDGFEIELSGSFSRGAPAHYDARQEQWEPGDSPELEGFAVFLLVGPARIDITEHLTAKQLARYAERLQESCAEGGDCGRD